VWQLAIKPDGIFPLYSINAAHILPII